MPASTRLTRALLALALGAAAVTTAGLRTSAEAQAPSADKKKLAKQYVDAGLAAQAAGDYDQAVALYQKAYDQVPHPLMFFNIGQAPAGLRTEAQLRLAKFRPATLGQAGRLEGVNPTDIMVVGVWLAKRAKTAKQG